MHWFKSDLLWSVHSMLATVGAERGEAQFGISSEIKPGSSTITYLVFHGLLSTVLALQDRGNRLSSDGWKDSSAFVVHGLWPQHKRGYPQFCNSNSRVE